VHKNRRSRRTRKSVREKRRTRRKRHNNNNNKNIYLYPLFRGTTTPSKIDLVVYCLGVEMSKYKYEDFLVI
jgi:hypothetical protein